MFEETTNSGKTYIYVYNDSVVLETSDYKSISVLSIDTGVILGLKDASYDLISAKTKDIIKKDITDDSFYYGDSVFMYKDYDYKKGKNVIYMIKDGEVYNSLYADFEIYKPFLNKVAIVKYADNTDATVYTDITQMTKKKTAKVNIKILSGKYQGETATLSFEIKPLTESQAVKYALALKENSRIIRFFTAKDSNELISRIKKVLLQPDSVNEKAQQLVFECLAQTDFKG